MAPTLHSAKQSRPAHVSAALEATDRLLALKNYSPNTIKNYRNWLMLFFYHFEERKPSTISKEEVMGFLQSFRQSSKWSASSQNQLINAIKFFYEQVLKQPRVVYDLPRAQKPEQLPRVISEEAIAQMINGTDNVKHKTMLCLLYAGGLRVSEVCDLRLTDIDSKRMVITLRCAKGMKDRQVMLSEMLLELCREYYKTYKPKHWLLEGAGGRQYSVRSVQQVVKQAAKKAGIRQKVTAHTFRHSFATHLLEGGTDVISIQKLLGHSSIRTTTIYAQVSKTHLQKIQSPLDKLKLNKPKQE